MTLEYRNKKMIKILIFFYCHSPIPRAMMAPTKSHQQVSQSETRNNQLWIKGKKPFGRNNNNKKEQGGPKEYIHKNQIFDEKSQVHIHTKSTNSKSGPTYKNMCNQDLSQAQKTSHKIYVQKEVITIRTLCSLSPP